MRVRIPPSAQRFLTTLKCRTLHSFLKKANIFDIIDRMLERDKNKEYIANCGQVRWGMTRNAGYKGGLENFVDNKSFKDFGAAYWFCRDVAISISNPGAEQQDVVKSGKELVKDGVVSQNELNYIYSQFGFNETVYQPPDLEAQTRRFIEALKENHPR